MTDLQLLANVHRALTEVSLSKGNRFRLIIETIIDPVRFKAFIMFIIFIYIFKSEIYMQQ